MSNAIYNTYTPIYLKHIGNDESQIGILLALGPLVAIASQPFWGMAGDRAGTKNTILRVLLLGSAVVAVLYPISVSFYYMAAVIALFMFFRTSVAPISDAITLEYLDSTRWKFGMIRMAGTLGYAFMSVVAGMLAHHSITSIYYLYFIIAIISFGVTFKLPAVKGHQVQGHRVSVLELLKNREMILLMSFSLMIHIAIGYYYSFFSIYYKSIGADDVLLGWSMFITAVSEIPFLLFADRIVKKLGIKLTLVISAAAAGVRWLAFYLVTHPYAVLPFQMLHGFNFIVLTYCMAIYINKEAPKELKASGQTLNGLLTFGLAPVSASLLGGFLSKRYGIRQMFLYDSLFTFAIVLIFGGVFLLTTRKKPKTQE